MLIHSNHYIFEHPYPQQIAESIPGTRVVDKEGKHYVAVPHKLEAAQILNHLGVKVESPILHSYRWPGRYTPFAHQRETVNFLTLNKRAYVTSGLGCVDCDTEFLTPTGWKRIADWGGEKVMQYNKDTGVASFAPAKFVEYEAGPMYHLKTGRGVDQVLSPEHRVLYRKPHNGELDVITCEELVAHHNTKTKGFMGGFLTTFDLERRPGVNLTDEQLRVMVAVIADGYFPSSTPRCMVRVKKARKKERIRALLGAAGIPFTESSKDYPTAQGYTVFTFRAPRREKEFTDWWWWVNAEQAAVVYDEVQYWDSSNSPGNRGFVFHSTVKASADYIQFVCAVSGKTASIGNNGKGKQGKNDCYSVVARTYAACPSIHSIDKDGKRHQTIFDYKVPDGKKYCFSVPDTFWVARRNGNIFITGNTGKTISALYAADWLIHHGYAHKVLIVSPLSTLDHVWGKEIFVNFSHRTYGICHGSREKRHTVLDQKHDFTIVNHHGVEIILDALLKRPDIDLIIIDELRGFFNPQTKLWKALKKVVERNVWVWGMTGSPIPNAPTDAYGQIKLVTPEKYQGSFTRFKQDTMIQVSQFRWVPRAMAETLVYSMMQPAIRYDLRDCVDLPETIYQTRHADLSPQQARVYKELSKQAAAEVNGTQITAVNAGVLLGKLLQAGLGSIYDEHGDTHDLDYGPRLEVVKECLDECAEKVILFVPFTGALNALYHKLKKEYSCVVVDGSTSAGKRKEIFNAFQNQKEPRVLIANPAATAHGLTLVAASTIVWVCPTTSNEVYLQANGRIVRPGQKNVTNIIHISATPAEDKVYTALKEKGKLQDALLNLYKV